jgi:hypothetical protein
MDRMELKELLNGRKSVTVIEPAEGHDGLVVTYSPDNVSLKQYEAIRKMEDIDMVVNMLLVFDVEWNLKRDGVPVPFTKDSLMELPARVLKMTLTAIQDDSGPKETSATS